MMRDSSKTIAAAVLLAMMLIAALVGVIAYVRRPIPYEVRTTAWTCTHEYLQQHEVHDSGWDAPDGAYNIRTETRQHGTRDCNPYDCSYYGALPSEGLTFTRPGGGHTYSHPSPPPVRRPSTNFSSPARYNTTPAARPAAVKTMHHRTCYHSCPRYDTWYEYDVMKWVVVARTMDGGDGLDGAICEPTVADPTKQMRQRALFKGVVRLADPKIAHEFCDYTTTSIPTFRGYAAGTHWLVRKDLFGAGCTPEKAL